MVKQALVRALGEFGGEVDERGNAIGFAKVVAERKTFLSRKRLVYRASIRVDEEKREVHLSESLTESGLGLASESGVGFKTETYRTGRGPREGGIAEQSKLFGKVYAYTFDHGAIRAKIEALAREHGHIVRYHVAGL
jgi:hypothetical protein